jgi:hypothetical protein
MNEEAVRKYPRNSREDSDFSPSPWDSVFKGRTDSNHECQTLILAFTVLVALACKAAYNIASQSLHGTIHACLW